MTTIGGPIQPNYDPNIGGVSNQKPSGERHFTIGAQPDLSSAIAKSATTENSPKAAVWSEKLVGFLKGNLSNIFKPNVDTLAFLKMSGAMKQKNENPEYFDEGFEFGDFFPKETIV